METKKIVAIIGSPKKTGQTIDQLRAFENCLEEHDGIEIENLFLSDYNLKECLGCNLCFDRGEEHCPLHDDRDFLLSKMLDANAVIWVSPIYAMHISHLMKKYLDRLAYQCHRPAFQSKKAFLLVVKGDQFQPSIKYLHTILESWGFDCVGSLGSASIATMPEKVRQMKMKQMKKLAASFVAQITEKKKKSPSLMELLNFKMWQTRAMTKDPENRDYRYFVESNLVKKDYFYDTKTSKAKLYLSSLVFQLLKIYIKREMGGFENA